MLCQTDASTGFSNRALRPSVLARCGRLVQTALLALVTILSRHSSLAAVLDFTPPLTQVNVSQIGGSTVSYNVFDPERSTFVGDSDNTGSVVGLQNQDGVVTWNNGSAVFLRIYNPSLGMWVKSNILTGATIDLQTQHGVVAWSGGGFVFFWVYDASRLAWNGGFASVPGTVSDLRTAHGVAAWTTGSPQGSTVYYTAFDPVRGQWVGQSLFAGASVFDLVTIHGVAAWSAGNNVFFRTYDPLRASWRGDQVNSGTTFDLKVDNGVVAWSHLSVVYFVAYDPLRGAWTGSTTTSGQTFNLAIQNGTVSWTANTVNFTRGFNTSNGQWAAGLTVPFAAFGASTNAGNAPLRLWFFDMSLGASSWSWNFGNGATTTRRSPFQTYENFASNFVTLTVSGPGGGNNTTNLVVFSDISPPVGTNVINNGEPFTTNATVSLTLSASDNSGVVSSMRFSNDNLSWSNWEAFAPTKTWVLSPGNGAKTVFAQFRDAAFNVSASASDNIELDTTAPPTAAFNVTQILADEGTNQFTVQVVLSSLFSRTVTVDFMTLDGSASAGSDYTSVTGRLTFPPGQTNQPIHLQILDDAQVEINESFVLQLSNPTNAVAGSPATITIVDNDPPSVSFANASFEAVENSSQANITVRLDATSGRLVTVRYSASGGTASPFQDFTPVQGIVTFNPGQSQATFPIPLINDSLDEFTETIHLQLASPTNAVLGVPSLAVLNLLDDDPPTVRFAKSQFAISEVDSPASIVVSLTKPYAQTIFVDYNTSNGTARAGSDYLATTGTLIFTPGQTNKSFPVNTLASPTVEPTEFLWLFLSSPVNASLGTPVLVKLLIVDGENVLLIDPVKRAGDAFGATVAGPIDQRLTIQVSSNLVTWSNLVALTNVTGNAAFTDPGSSNAPHRAYRVRVP